MTIDYWLLTNDLWPVTIKIFTKIWTMKLPETYKNFISYLGTITATIAFITVIILIIITKFFSVGSVYFDLFTFIVVPCFLVAGLVLIAFGMFRTWRRRKSPGKKFPEINLNNKKHRNAAAAFIIISTIILSMINFTLR